MLAEPPLHRYARLPLFLYQNMSSASPFPIAGSGWQLEGVSLVLVRGDLRTAAVSSCWAKCRVRLRDTVVTS